MNLQEIPNKGAFLSASQPKTGLSAPTPRRRVRWLRGFRFYPLRTARRRRAAPNGAPPPAFGLAAPVTVNDSV